MSHAGAANAASVSEAEFYRERDRDKAFDSQVREADAASEEVLLDLATKAAAKDGRVAVMLLERRHSGWRKPSVNAEVKHLHAHAQIPAEMLQSLAKQRQIRDAKSKGDLEFQGNSEGIVVDCVPIVNDPAEADCLS